MKVIFSSELDYILKELLVFIIADKNWPELSVEFQAVLPDFTCRIISLSFTFPFSLLISTHCW